MKKKILIVDDSITARKLICEAIDRSRFDIIEAENGNVALAVFESDPEIELVISDVNMPGMDGLTLVQELRKADQNQDVNVIMVTTESTMDQISTGRSLGVTGWIVKPIKKEQLCMAVETLLNPPK